MLRAGCLSGPQSSLCGPVQVSRFKCCAKAPLRASHPAQSAAKLIADTAEIDCFGAILSPRGKRMSYSEDLHAAALAYHRLPRPGKLEIQATKPLANQRELAVGYKPRV